MKRGMKGKKRATNAKTERELKRLYFKYISVANLFSAYQKFMDRNNLEDGDGEVGSGEHGDWGRKGMNSRRTVRYVEVPTTVM